MFYCHLGLAANYYDIAIDPFAKYKSVKQIIPDDGAYFGLSGHLFRFHPARRFGVIRPA
jgi:hypothetical protein